MILPCRLSRDIALLISTGVVHETTCGSQVFTSSSNVRVADSEMHNGAKALPSQNAGLTFFSIINDSLSGYFEWYVRAWKR